MDVLLATPVNKTHYCVPPLGLGYLISSLRKNGFSSVTLLDSNKENLDHAGFADCLKKSRPKILGVQCFSFDVAAVNKMFGIAKKMDPGIITIIGGPHPSAVHESIFGDCDNLDFAFSGEAEESLPLFIQAVLGNKKSFKDIPGLIFRDNSRVVVNPPNTFKYLDALDMPAWDLMNPNKYPEEVQGAFYKNFPVAPIITSRGCPYECTFCSNNILMGRTLRFRDIEKVVNEIRFLNHNYGVKEIHILDDNFTIDKKRTLKFCSRIKEEGLRVSIAFPNGVRLDTLDEEMLLALKEIGVYSITAGIESGSQKILYHMKKALSLDVIKEKIKLIKKIGLDINAFFIIGYPTETKGDIIKTIQFARRLPLTMAHFSCFLPLPGTEITRELLNSGRLKKIDYSKLFYANVPFSPEGITKRGLKRLQQIAFLSFYLRPHILLDLLLRLRSFRHFKSILKRAGDYTISRCRAQDE